MTLVAEAEDLDGIDGLQQDETAWRVVRVGEGAEGFEKVGVIERITGPLAAAGISVLYVSTFSTDYVLIPSSRLDEALQQFGSAGSARSEAPDEPSQRHTHPLNVLDSATRFQIERRHRSAHTSALIRLLFMPAQEDPSQPIASLTETPDEISILAAGARHFAMERAQSCSRHRVARRGTTVARDNAPLRP